jgi:aspartate carbamoyltransferase catalytic subunit
LTIDAMGADLMVVRHSEHGAVKRVAECVGASVLNAGDGAGEHPTQALLDALTMRRAFGQLEGLTVAICGDLRHSRVARSNGRLLPTLGAKVRLAGPRDLIPDDAEAWDAEVMHDLDSAVRGADVVMMLRIQRERMNLDPAPSAETFANEWGLNRTRLALAADHVRVMHPGPMNRGVEITSDVADDPALSLIRTQVRMGVAMRMAVMSSLAQRRLAQASR